MYQFRLYNVSFLFFDLVEKDAIFSKKYFLFFVMKITEVLPNPPTTQKIRNNNFKKRFDSFFLQPPPHSPL